MSSIFEHKGPWNEHSRQSPALSFLEEYTSTIDSLDLSHTPASAFYAPTALFHDTTGKLYTGAPEIWHWIKGLFAPFSRLHHRGVQFRVVPQPDGTDIIYADCMTEFTFAGDTEPVEVPRFFVFTVGKSMEEGYGFAGMQIRNVRLFWDTGLLAAHLKKRAMV